MCGRGKLAAVEPGRNTVAEVLATCGECGHKGHGVVGGVESSDRRCNHPRCKCNEWSSDLCPGVFGECQLGECPGRNGGGHTPGCPDHPLG